MATTRKSRNASAARKAAPAATAIASPPDLAAAAPVATPQLPPVAPPPKEAFARGALRRLVPGSSS